MTLYNKYRPTTLDEVCGQELAVKQLRAFLAKGSVPKAILFSGGPGVGKTTLARILSRELGSPPVQGADFKELNTADFRGIDTVRDLNTWASYAPMNGRASVYILDEFQKTTKDAQSALLKLLEDALPRRYFFICTTEPERILKAIRTRCTNISLGAISDGAVLTHLNRIIKGESLSVSSKVLAKIVQAAQGIAREAAVKLEAVAGLATEEDQLAAVGDPEHAGKTVAQLLFSGGSWPEVVKALDEAKKTTEAESLRHAVLGYGMALLRIGGHKAARAFEVMRVFRHDLYSYGWPGMYAYCYEVSSQKK